MIIETRDDLFLLPLWTTEEMGLNASEAGYGAAQGCLTASKQTNQDKP